MNKFYFLSTLCALFMLFSNAESGSSQPSDLKLELVQMLFRHGDRNVLDPTPNDPYKNESFWPEGFGQLTNIGKNMHYNLGKWLREQYDGFISQDYSPYEIRIESSDVDRCLMSAEANLAGLYYPKDSISLWNKNIKWQPLPVHSTDTKHDNKLRMSAPCPKYDKLYKAFMQYSPVMKEINSKNKELYEYLTLHTGRKIYDPKEVQFLYDDLYIENLRNYKLPEWAEKVYPHQMKSASVFSFIMTSYTQKLKRLKGGPLIGEMLKHMESRVNGKMDNRQKMFMYSAHDTTISTIMNSLGVFNMEIPPYACLLLVNLFVKPGTGQYFVKVSFKNESNHSPYPLIVPGCQELCPLNTFADILRPIIPGDWETECQLSILDRFLDFDNNKLPLVIGISLSFLLVVTMMSFTWMKLKGWKTSNAKGRKYPYKHLSVHDEEFS